jgi:hypothetical protein
MKDTRDDLIPGAPADSLVGLGGCDGFVGQVERGMCSTAPPPPPKPVAAVERSHASYPPVPIPNLPPMPLRARLLRPWIAGAGGALLIALAAWANGDDTAPADEAAPSAAAGSEVRGAEDFGSMVQAHAANAVAQAKEEARVAQAALKAAADQEPETELGDEDQDAAANETATASSKAKPAKKAAKRGFSRDAARSAVFGAANRASGCRTKKGPKGRGRATVTIAPSGRVTGVSVSGPFSGTKSGRCIASVFRSVRVAPFAGSSVTLGKSFTVR